MESTLIRVGNEAYARENKSFGLTTMRNRHVEVNGSKITFNFQGKSRVHHTINLQDRRLANIVRRCTDIPGYELFQYLDPDGDPHSIDSADVNDYLQDHHRPILHRQGLPHLGWLRPRLRPAARVRSLRPPPRRQKRTSSRPSRPSHSVSAILPPSAANVTSIQPCSKHYLNGDSMTSQSENSTKRSPSMRTPFVEEERTLVKLSKQRLLLEKAS